MKTTLIKGDPLVSCDLDYLAQVVHLKAGEQPHGYDGRNCGWRVLDGNHLFNTWVRVAKREEIAAQCDMTCLHCGEG